MDKSQPPKSYPVKAGKLLDICFTSKSNSTETYLVLVNFDLMSVAQELGLDIKVETMERICQYLLENGYMRPQNIH